MQNTDLEKEMLEVMAMIDDSRIEELEQEGLSHSDAVGVAMCEATKKMREAK